MSSRRNSADYEGEPFDDAPEVLEPTNSLSPSIPQHSSTRSLTENQPGGTGVAIPTSESPSLAAALQSEDREEVDEFNRQLSDNEETSRKTFHNLSPLSANRLSTTSLDEVNLTGSKDDEQIEQLSSIQNGKPSPPPVPRRDSLSFHSSRAQGLSGSLSSIPVPPPPMNRNSTPTTLPQQQPRKLPGPFSWLTRASTGTAKAPPPQSSRRHTEPFASAVTNHTGPGDGDDPEDLNIGLKRSMRNSLKDQFKLLRMREEGQAPENDESSVTSRHTSVTCSNGGSPSVPEEGESGVSFSNTPSPSTTAVINPKLAPGTVSGVSASAADASVPVNWELWQQLVNHGPQALTGANSDDLNAAIKRGIPQTIRGVIWQVLANSRNTELEDIYRELVTRGTDRDIAWRQSSNGQTNGCSEKGSVSPSRVSVKSEQSSAQSNAESISNREPDTEKQNKDQVAAENARKRKAKESLAALQKLEKAIRRDLGARTSYSRYFISQGNQESLFGLCKAYALYDERVGYAQGMNFIVMPLLFNMDEVEAFTLLVKLMNHYGLREMFIHDMPGLHRCLYLFERLLEDLEPAVYCHLRRRSVPPQLYATQWFLTLFAYRFPLQLVLRVYDLIFEEGLESTILKFAVAIMRRNSEALLGMRDMSTLSAFLKERLFDVYIDKQPSATSILESGFFGSAGAADKEVYRADVLVQDACAIPLTSEMINEYMLEWEEKVRGEKEREMELETLRHTVLTHSTRIRSLEEQAEASDKEHVQLASELVHVKVEKEELQDMSDALKLQVSELKNVVDRQPAEVEEKLRTEMDRIMKRNLEVQNENRSMMEQMAEMEKELVKAKMQWAEISENHENLKQKWNDLRKALD